MFQAPKVESRELNYDELDMELKELQKVIKNVNKSQGISFSAFYYNIHCKIYIILYMYNILYVLIFSPSLKVIFVKTALLFNMLVFALNLYIIASERYVLFKVILLLMCFTDSAI